ncbi:MAG: hypothetical protein GY851_02110 [bacterium]|nr:hypothetical protein [bacterium]
MRYCLSAIVLIGLVCGAVSAQTMEKNTKFLVNDAPVLQVASGGKVLIASDGLSDEIGLPEPDEVVTTELDDGKAINVYRATSDVLDYRREIAVRNTDAGNTASLTFRCRLYPYHETPGVSYAFRVPAATLDGFAYKAVTDRPYRQKTPSGTLKADAPDGAVVSGLAFLSLIGPNPTAADGHALRAYTMDFAPSGRGLYYNVRSKGMVGNAWSLRKEGDFFVFRVGLRGRWYGGMMTTKVVIHDQQIAYNEIHPAPDEWHYAFAPQTTLALSADDSQPEGTQILSTDAFAEGKLAGWESSAGLARVPGILGGMIAGKTGTLRLMPPPGAYLVTVRFGADTAVGPFDLTANGRPAGSGLKSDPGKVTSHTFSSPVAAAGLALGFSSDALFGVSAVVMQRVATDYEAKQALMGDIWTVADVPTPDKDIKPGRRVSGEFAKLPPFDEWRWNMAMTNLGPDNISSRNELVTYADIERRIKEVIDAGFNTVILNGLHFRLCHPREMGMMTANTKRICDVAHRYGVRVIEHHDVPIFQAQNDGYRALLAVPHWLTEDIATGKQATMACVANPQFRGYYYKWFRDYVRETGIDGCMLDEVTFFGPTYCGCEHCRAAFTVATGLTLPYKDTDGVFGNKDNATWVAWEKWRVEASADFFKGIRAIFDEVNPEATLMTYTTHYGFTSSYGSRRFGSDIVARAEHIDFLGTEIMSRNVMSSYRSVFGFRKAKAALGLHFDAPIWGLVYHLDDPDLAYFGWALLHMNRQVGWIASIEGFDLGRFVNWPGKMNVRDAEPLSDMAVVFSRTCCNYNRSSAHAAAAMGCSQQLSDAHIQHDVILDLDLTPETLERYRVVVLAAVECLSDEAVQVLQDYVAGGGSVVVTGRTSQSDANGILRDKLGLSDLLGVELDGDPMAKPCSVKVGRDDPFQVDAGAVRVKAAQGTRVLGWVVDDAGKPVTPAVTYRRVGEGHAVYLAVPFGAANYMREYTAGDTFDFALNEPARDVLLKLARSAAAGPLTFEATGIPEDVLVSAYKVPTGYAIHFLNARGAGLEPGDTLPKAAPKDAFAPLDEDLEFELRGVAAITAGRLVSPDYERPRDPKIEVWADRYTVTIPRDALEAYTILYLDCEEDSSDE